MTKEMFCTEFCKLLQKTEQHKDLAQLVYTMGDDGDEWVMAIWKTRSGLYGKPIDVTADSETAMIKDILRGIE